MDGTTCVFCNENLYQDSERNISGKSIVSVGVKGIEGIVHASILREDGLGEKIGLLQAMQVHDTCRKDYTRPSSIKKFLNTKKADEQNEVIHLDHHTRSAAVKGFDFKTHCLFCAKEVDFRSLTKLPYKYRKVVHTVETLPIKDTILAQATVRSDIWGREVDARIREASDLVAAEAIYHHDCYVTFFSSKNLKTSSKPGRGKCEVPEKRDAFLQLCAYLDANDECQYSIGELSDIMDTFLAGTEGYTSKHLKTKLLSHYGQNVTATELPGLKTILSFRSAAHKILHDKWYEEKKVDLIEERLRVVEAAAEIVRADIRSEVYKLDEYPPVDPDSLTSQSLSYFVPHSLQRFIDVICKSKSTDTANIELKQVSISQAIISACRPRSFLSPILLGVGLYIHKHYASRLLIDLLNRLGFSASYTEVQRYEYSLLSMARPNHHHDSYVQFVFDNADFNARTLDGRGTFHVMGGIKCITPARDYLPVGVSRILTVPPASEIAAMGDFNISYYKKPSSPGLRTIDIQDIYTSATVPAIVHVGRRIDLLWMTGPWLDCLPHPSWNGFMQAAYKDSSEFERSTVEPVPFINLDPGNLSTINTALTFAAGQCKERGQGSCFVTFDQPLYAKAVEIVAAAGAGSNLDNIRVRLGGFHLLISFLGAVGFIMSGSGLEEVWAEVYAKASVPHMITGHAYARSIRAHFLTQLALGVMLLQKLDSCDDKHDELRHAYRSVLTNDLNPVDAAGSDVLASFEDALARVCTELENSSRTGRMWIAYFRLVSLMRLFIRAERTGDFELHIYCVTAMLPYFHASGHLQYAKYAHLYVQQMKELSNTIPEKDFKQFVTAGFFTIRRKDRFWSGNWSDMVIEQELMRELKVSGGLTHGRGITDSNLAKFVLAQPACSIVNSALEKLCRVSGGTGEQHVELRDSRQSRDERDLRKMLSWLQSHSPFEGYSDDLVSLSSGVVADSKINADSAHDIGVCSLLETVGQNFGDVKMKRRNKVIPLSSMSGTIRVRDQEVIEVNPQQLFLRISCVLKTPSEYEEYMCYELAPKPPSLFDGPLMRKTPKSTLADILETSVPCVDSHPVNSVYVVDGGHLLHQVSWPRPATYQQVCSAYVSFMVSHYGRGTIVVFDGYEGPPTTKTVEQNRRSARVHSSTVIFELPMVVSATQSDFLGNGKNKTRLIDALTPQLFSAGITALRATADADTLIVDTALQKAHGMGPVTVVGTDSDLLALLVAKANPSPEIFFLKPGGQKPDKIYNISAISQNIGQMKHCILFAHAISGCDTTSAIFKKGKKGTLENIRKG